MPKIHGLRFEYDPSEFEIFGKFRDMFWTVRKQLLVHIGYKGKRLLKESYLSGQYLDLKKYPRDVIGRRTVKYQARPLRSYVTVASYPLNLFEKGRMLRSGRKEPGKRVMRKFKSSMNSKMQGIVNEYDTRQLQKLIRHVERGGKP